MKWVTLKLSKCNLIKGEILEVNKKHKELSTLIEKNSSKENMDKYNSFINEIKQRKELLSTFVNKYNLDVRITNFKEELTALEKIIKTKTFKKQKKRSQSIPKGLSFPQSSITNGSTEKIQIIKDNTYINNFLKGKVVYDSNNEIFTKEFNDYKDEWEDGYIHLQFTEEEYNKYIKDNLGK